MSEVTEKLKKIGFTEYESKIYISLIGRTPVNGNEISTLSGVPGPKVYGCLQSMSDKGYVSVLFDEQQKKPKAKYKAIPYEQLLQLHLTSVSQDIEILKAEFKKIEDNRPNLMLKQDLYQILDYELTFQTIKELIDASQMSIYMCCWKEHEQLVRKELEKAHERGVKIIILVFNSKEDNVPWKEFNHMSMEIVEKRHRDELNIIVDEKHVLISHLKQNNVFTVVSGNIALIKTTLNYIRHDIYVNRVLSDFYIQAKKKYGPELQDLLNI